MRPVYDLLVGTFMTQPDVPRAVWSFGDVHSYAATGKVRFTSMNLELPKNADLLPVDRARKKGQQKRNRLKRCG